MRMSFPRSHTVYLSMCFEVDVIYQLVSHGSVSCIAYTFVGDERCHYNTDSEIVMVDGTFWDDSFEQDRSWDDFGTTISGI